MRKGKVGRERDVPFTVLVRGKLNDDIVSNISESPIQPVLPHSQPQHLFTSRPTIKPEAMHQTILGIGGTAKIQVISHQLLTGTLPTIHASPRTLM